MALFCTKADYTIAFHVASEPVWLRRIVGKLKVEQKQVTPLLCDNYKAMK